MPTGNSVIRDALARKNEQSPQYDYLWRVELPSLDPPIDFFDGSGGGGFLSNFINSFGVGGSTFTDILSNVFGGVANPMSEINHRVSEFNNPFFTMDTKKITDKNSYWYAASNNDIGTISMTMDEFEDGVTLKYLNGWKDLIVNSDGTYNPPYYYKRDIRFIRMSATNLDLHIHNYKGYFINALEPISNTYEGNGVLQYSATLTGDSVQHIMIPEAQVRASVLAAESSIMLQDWANDKFRLDDMKGARTLRLLSEVAGLFN